MDDDGTIASLAFFNPVLCDPPLPSPGAPRATPPPLIAPRAGACEDLFELTDDPRKLCIFTCANDYADARGEVGQALRRVVGRGTSLPHSERRNHRTTTRRAKGFISAPLRGREPSNDDRADARGEALVMARVVGAHFAAPPTEVRISAPRDDMRHVRTAPLRLSATQTRRRRRRVADRERIRVRVDARRRRPRGAGRRRLVARQLALARRVAPFFFPFQWIARPV